MNKILTAALLATSLAGSAQSPEDALRMSYITPAGTARSMAIGGAMGSLGGDISSTFVNPAGLGMFRNYEVVFSPGYLQTKNNFTYRDAKTSNSLGNLTLGTSGFVLGNFKGLNLNDSKKSWGTMAFAINQTANFKNHYQYKALNNYSSYSEVFAEGFFNSGMTIDGAMNTPDYAFDVAPALYTYLVDTVRQGGQTIIKAAPEYILDNNQALLQDFNRTTKGGVYEAALAMAHNDGGKWMFGGAIGIPLMTYKSDLEYTESDTSTNTANYFDRFTYKDNFSAQGAGFNVKLGAIFRPQEYIRLGLSVHTPSWMLVNEKRTTWMQTKLEPPFPPLTNPADDNVSSKYFNGGQVGSNEYLQITPWKFIGSASYVFREIQDITRQKGFITADVEYIAHSGGKFDSKNAEQTDQEKAYFKALKNVIKQEYKGAFNFRLGGELKFNTIMVRLGAAHYMSPYRDKQLKANKTFLSGGLGYRNKGMFIDATYVYGMGKSIDFPYRLETRANTYASNKSTSGNIMFTVGVKL